MVLRKAPPKVDKAAEAAAFEAAKKESARAARKEAKRAAAVAAALKKLQAVITQTAVVTTDESQSSLRQPKALTESEVAMVDRADQRLRSRDPEFPLLPPGPRARRLAEHTTAQ